jgi:hypothetical protein
MNRIAGSLLLNLVVSSLGLWAMPVQAQGFRINRDSLPDASQIERSRLKLQLVDTGPEITDHRKNQDQTEYIINVPPVRQETSTPAVLQAGSEIPSAASQNGMAPPVMIAPKHPQESRFGSNMPVGGNQRQRPSHGSSGFRWVAGQLINKPTQMPAEQLNNKAAQMPAHREPMIEQRQSPPLRVAEYGPSQVGTSASSLGETSISARGRLLRSK